MITRALQFGSLDTTRNDLAGTWAEIGPRPIPAVAIFVFFGGLASSIVLARALLTASARRYLTTPNPTCGKPAPHIPDPRLTDPGRPM